MSHTEEQKAYHLRKMRTKVDRLDANKDGFVSREDFEVMSERLAKYSKLDEAHTKKVHDVFLQVADWLQLQPGTRIPVEKYAVQMSENLLSKSPEKVEMMIRTGHTHLFEAIDTNNDGHISVQEFIVYLKVLAPTVTEEEAKHSFEVIDTDKNGEISREEFFAAAKDFFFGVEETEISRVFWGKLLD